MTLRSIPAVPGFVLTPRGPVGIQAIFTKSDVGATYYSIGPTGSGASKIFTHLNDIPTGTRYIVLFAGVDVVHSSDATATCGSTGMFHDYNLDNRYGYIEAECHLQNEKSNSSAVFIIPIDASKRFKMQFTGTVTANSTHDLHLQIIGYIP